MADTIASWGVKLTANASGLTTVLDQSAAKIKSFSALAVTSTKTMATGVNSAIANVTGLNLGAQTQQLQNMAGAVLGVGAAIATGGVAAIVGSIAAAGASLIAFASASMDAVAVQVKLGRQIGITAQEAAGLQILADKREVSSESLTSGLNVWARQLGTLQTELHSGADGPISQGLARLNIDARNFGSLGVAEQFAQIAEGAQRIGNVSERNAVLFNILSRRASDMIPLFMSQGSELRNLGSLAESYGYSLTQGQAEGIAATVRQLKELSRYVGSLVNMWGQQLALIWSPAASAAGDMLKSLVTEARPVTQMFLSIGLAGMGVVAGAVFGIVAAVNNCMPAIVAFGQGIQATFDFVVAAFASVTPFATEMGSSIREVFSSIVEWIGSVLSPVGAMIGGVFDVVKTTVVSLWPAVTETFTAIKDVVVLTFTMLGEMAVGSGLVFTEWGAVLTLIVPVVTFFARMVATSIAGMVLIVTSQLATAARAVIIAATVFDTVTFGLTGANRVVDQARRMETALISAQNTAANAMITINAPTPIVNAFPSGVGGGDADPVNRFGTGLQGPLDDLEDRVKRMDAVLAHRNPFQAWRESLTDMRGILDDMNQFGIDPSRGYESVGRSMEALLNSNKQESRSPASVIAGSVAEQRAIVQAQMQDRDSSRDPIERLIQVQQQEREHVRRLVELGEAAERARSEGRFDVIGS